MLVRHSAGLGQGDVCMVRADSAAEPLAQALYEEILRAGGLPMINLEMEGQEESLLRLASDEQLDWIPPPVSWATENGNVLMHLRAKGERALQDVDSARQARRQLAYRPVLEAGMRRAAAGELRFCTTLFPSRAHAEEAGLTVAEFEDLYYRACLCDQDDPVAAWRSRGDEVRRLAAWMSGRKEIHVTAPGVDLRLDVAGRIFVPGTGEQNMPDGEIFTAPLEDSVRGEVAFAHPVSYAGTQVAGARLRFDGGRVVDASAEEGEYYLLQMLDTDPGARGVGEFGLGANYSIEGFTGSVLLDEKIGGTFHLALGMSYPQTGGRNFSAIHWDMVCDLRRGGRIEVDGEPLQVDGSFVI